MIKEIKSLPDSVIAKIIKFLNEKNLLSDSLLRDGIFSLLDEYCTVLYYPQKNENNDGCHVQRLVNNKIENFVYINTYKSVEKQVFTAAHELGHILELDDYLKRNCSEYNSTMQEIAMNKFAALLLMPDDLFRKKIFEYEKDFCSAKGEITIDNLIKFSLLLMDYFFVPFKAVVIRLCEVGHLSDDDTDKIISNKLILEKINDYIKILGYKRLGIRSNKKSIKNFAELLEKAEENEVFPKAKIDSIRQKMELPEIKSESMSSTIKFVESKSE